MLCRFVLGCGKKCLVTFFLFGHFRGTQVSSNLLGLFLCEFPQILRSYSLSENNSRPFVVPKATFLSIRKLEAFNLSCHESSTYRPLTRKMGGQSKWLSRRGLRQNGDFLNGANHLTFERGEGSGLEDSIKNLPVASQAKKKKLMHCQLWQKEILHVLCSPPKIVQILHSSSLHVA